MVEIKSVDKESISSIALLLRQYWKERGLIYTKQWAEQYVELGHKIELKKEQTFMLLDNGKVIGTCSVIIWEGNVAELRDLVIKKEQRSKGYGKKLLEFSLEWCRRNNARKVFALIFQQNKPLFEQSSFTLEGFLKHHFKQNEHLLIMSLFPEKKPDTQVNLKNKFDDLHKIEDIEKETSSRLRGLST